MTFAWLGRGCWRMCRRSCWPTCGRPAGPPDSRPDRFPGPTGIDEFSGDELAWTLAWSRSYTHSQLLVAQQLFTRLPAVYAAFLAGRIDFVKAEAFISVLYDLDDETARKVADRLLDRADRWTLADLRERLRYHGDRADPAEAKKRYQRKVADRDVRAHADPDGTACLAGSNLPPDQALAAHNRVARLARTARAAGDPRTLAQLRADAFLALLAGIPFQSIPPTTPLTAEADALHPAHANEDDDGASDARRRGPTADPDSRSETGNRQHAGDADRGWSDRGRHLRRGHRPGPHKFLV